MQQALATAEHTPTIGGALEALAWEIELAGARCIMLDSLIGDLMPGMTDDGRARLVEGMQAVDLLSQHLTGLSAFLRRLGDGCADAPCPTADAALAEVTLGALADRLRAALGLPEAGVNDGDGAGDFDLF